MEKEVIGIAGLARSGKDTAAKYLKREYGFKWLNFSDILVKEAKKRGKKPTKASLSRIGDKYREKHGKAGLAVEIMNKIENSGSLEFVITGFRSPEEVEYIKKRVNKFLMAEIKTKKELRWKRREESDPNTKKEFFKRDEVDIKKKGLGEVLERADITIENNSNLKSLYRSLDELVKKFKDQ